MPYISHAEWLGGLTPRRDRYPCPAASEEAFLTLLDTGKTNATLVNWDCPLQSWKMVNQLTGEMRRFDCKSWHCLEHGPLNAWRWALRIGAIPWNLMVTITNVPESRELARKGWTALMRYLRTLGSITFVKAMELGEKHGMRHYHVLIAGVKWLNLPYINGLLKKYSHGWCYATPVKNKTRAARYVLKYPLKDLGQPNLRFRGWRTVTASRSVPSWKDVTRKFRGETFVEEGWNLVTNTSR